MGVSGPPSADSRTLGVLPGLGSLPGTEALPKEDLWMLGPRRCHAQPEQGPPS